ncbi:MAG: hypothetical protein QXT72_04815, partial [Candidatus Micrarchaeia archaeon]
WSNETQMLNEYYRNGLVFLLELEGGRSGQKLCPEDIRKKITDEYIKQNFREPAKELVGHSNIGTNASEKDILKNLKKYFEISSNSSEILGASFFNTRNGKCTYCGKEGEVFLNRPYVFPFERKIDSIAPEEARVQFCKQCGFIIYSGMANLYQKGIVEFFFDSQNMEYIKKINTRFRQLRDPSNFNKIQKFGIGVYFPHETIFVTFFEFLKYIYRKNLIKEIEEVIRSVRIVLVAGTGQIYIQSYVEGNILDKMAKFFLELIRESMKFWSEMDEEKKKKVHMAPEELIFSGFFVYLSIDKGDMRENDRLREEFTVGLLNGKMDFITLNCIIMERLKRNEKVVVPYYYLTFVRKFMEVFGLEKEMFEKINGLGYALGKQMKGTNLENFVWDIFRARGAEQFYNSLVELQAKLEISIDLRPINEYEKGWREAKAILLNGMLNALYGESVTEVDKNVRE